MSASRFDFPSFCFVSFTLLLLGGMHVIFVHS